MIQWHPIFAKLLRPAVEGYYEVQTTVPVGDKPRQADFVLLRRTTQSTPPFRGLWRHLTPWNILEFKGPTVSPRREHIELLIEVGLGIGRRLHEERGRQGQRRLPPEAVSFWYLANHLGRRFVAEVERKVGQLEPLGPGLWRSRLLGHLLFWVSNIDLPVEEDSLPLHIIGHEPLLTERQVAQLVMAQPDLQQRYGGWLASLHPEVWKEVETMARTAGRGFKIDLEAAVDAMGVQRVIETVGLERVIEQFGIGRVIEQVGIDRVIEQVGDKEVIKRIGLERLSAILSPAERRQLKRLLQ